MRRIAALAVLATMTAAAAGCGGEAIAVPGGDAERGRQALAGYGCAGCHELPGIDAPGGRVGPSLVGLQDRRYIAGDMPTDPERLAAWIQDPKRFDPDTLMPAFGMSDREARDIAAYLLSDP